MSLIENIQRENLNPMEEAAGLQRLVDEFKMTHEQAADAVGRSRTATTNLLRLLKLARPVQEMLLEGALEMGHARALLALDAARQIEAGTRVAAKRLSVRETEALVQSLLRGPGARRRKRADRDLARLEEEVSERLGTTVEIRAAKKGRWQTRAALLEPRPSRAATQRSCADMYNFAALLGAKRTNAMLRQLSKPIRTVLAMAARGNGCNDDCRRAASGALAAGSAAAGGLISVVAGLASAFVASRSDAKSAGGILFGALRAETVKIGLAVLLLWLVLANYGEAAVGVLVGSFVVTMLIFAMAFFVRDY